MELGPSESGIQAADRVLDLRWRLPVHSRATRPDVLGGEGCTLPAIGFAVCCFPFSIKGASAGFTRAVAILEDDR